MEFYNNYIKSPAYHSKFSFVGSNNSVMAKDIFYVEFHKEDSYFRNGFYVDQDNYLEGISKSFVWTKFRNEVFQHDLIKEVTKSKRFHSIIMIEER